MREKCTVPKESQKEEKIAPTKIINLLLWNLNRKYHHF